MVSRQRADEDNSGSIGGTLVGTVLLDRFEVLARLGRGGMGVVYESFDRKRDSRVALKTLDRLDAAGIYRLKNEFRSLADVVHPNLVGLHELHKDGPLWFFTMDLVPGVSFLEDVRVDPALGFEPTESLVGRDGDDTIVSESAVVAQSRVAESIREVTLRDRLRQLVLGLRAIHAAGKLHRDLKPANVLVRPDGRVVILDFGLASDQEGSVFGRIVADDRRSGTPAYMAPEQCFGAASTPAADWYAIGVMLFEALTGERPFHGAQVDVFSQKQVRPASRASELAPGIPEDLDDLCSALLEREPSARPTGSEVLERLGGARLHDPVEIVYRRGGPVPFVGRGRELSTLQGALDATDTGHPVIVNVVGPSGLGKTALVERFIEETDRDRNITVLTGRCHARERVPFKAFDGVIDGLTRHLRTLTASSAARLLPRHVHALVQLFPVLARVRAIADKPVRAPLPPDAQQQRVRAFAALKELLVRITDERSLVIFVDDVQWDDADSAALLSALLSPPDVPPLVLILACRSEERERSACLHALADATSHRSDRDVRELVLEPLDSEAVDALVVRTGAAGLDSARLYDESYGHPYLLAEVVRHALDRGSEAPPSGPILGGLSLDAALFERARRLPLNAYRALEAMAVAGRPVDAGLLGRVAGLGAELPGVLTALTVASLARSRGRDREAIEPYHDRVRVMVAASLSARERFEWHERFATELERTGSDDFEALIDHWDGAGEPDRALEYAVRASERAASSLAFEHAAALCRRALALRPDDELRRGVQRRLGDVLAAAGRGADAAEAYDAAAELADEADAFGLHMQAAAQRLFAGHVERGMAGLADALSRLGVEFPSTAEASLKAMRAMSERLDRRSFDLVPRDAEEIDPRALARIDACWATALGLFTVDEVPGRTRMICDLQLDEALEAGEPMRVARAAFLRAQYQGCLGHRAPAGAVDLALALGREAARHIDDPRVDMWRRFSEGWRAFYEGRPGDALADLEEADRVARESCHGMFRELSMLRMTLSSSLYFLGRFAEQRARNQAWIGEARARGDVYGESWLRVLDVGPLMDDNPEACIEEMERHLATWARGRDYVWWVAQMTITAAELGLGRLREAHSRAERGWAAISKSSAAVIPQQRCQAAQIRGKAALAVATTGHGAGDALAVVDECVGILNGEPLPHYQPAAMALRAEISRLRGDVEQATALYGRAIEGFAAPNGNRVEAARCMRARGALMGGSEGRALEARAREIYSQESIVNSERWVL